MNNCELPMTLVSLDAVKLDDWTFKVSVNNDTGVIMVHSFNVTFMWSQVRFFNRESEAKNYVDYLVLQSGYLKEKE